MPASSATNVSYLARVAGQFWEHVDIEILDLPAAGNDQQGNPVAPVAPVAPVTHIPEALRNRLKEYDQIIAAVYSRSPNIEQLQAEPVKELIGLRSDVIVVALGNPYDIRNFPLVDTYVVTYGFREVQVEALFRVLTGVIKPTGQLPVEIRGLFPRWHA
ncbi:MAG: beta-N-acetylhexosaminidase [Acidobacteriota bacterium]|nr:beta-N-acetylhexosaminidase [Acidobacteriota bacterium]